MAAIGVLVLIVIAGGIYGVRHLPSFNPSSSLSNADADELARARSAMGGGQLSAFEKVLSKRPRSTLDNAAILRLWNAKVGTQVILQMMRTSNGDYDVSPNAVIALRQAQVDESIILAMIDQSNVAH